MPAPKAKDFWMHIEEYPPLRVRLLAKTRDGPCLSDEEIAIASGLSLSRVREINRLQDWGGVSMGEMRDYFSGCNFDPTKATDRSRVKKYEYACKKRPNMKNLTYMRRSPVWETEILPLVKLKQQRENFSEILSSA